MAGLPGSGLGGLFYILLLLWVFIRQAFTGSMCPERSRQLIPLGFMAAGMIGMLAVTAWLLALIIGPLPTFASIAAPSDNTGRWALILGMMPLISIAILLGGLQVARRTIARRSLR
jgi:hypothetical protein